MNNSILPLICMFLLILCEKVVNSFRFYFLSLYFSGASIALDVTYWCQTLLLIAYIAITKVHRSSWTGWNRECLLKWKEFNVDFLPSVLQILVWIFSAEMCNILAGATRNIFLICLQYVAKCAL